MPDIFYGHRTCRKLLSDCLDAEVWHVHIFTFIQFNSIQTLISNMIFDSVCWCQHVTILSLCSRETRDSPLMGACLHSRCWTRQCLPTHYLLCFLGVICTYCWVTIFQEIKGKELCVCMTRLSRKRCGILFLWYFLRAPFHNPLGNWGFFLPQLFPSTIIKPSLKAIDETSKCVFVLLCSWRIDFQVQKRNLEFKKPYTNFAWLLYSSATQNTHPSQF